MPEVIFGLIAIASIALYIREYSARRKAEEDLKPKPVDEAGYETISSLTEKSREIVHDAEKNASKLVDEVKEFDIKSTQDFGQKISSLLESEQAHTRQAEEIITTELKNQEQKFESYLKHLTSVLDNKTDASLEDFKLFLDKLAKESRESQSANWEGARVRVGELFENFETKLADFLVQTEQKMMLSVDLELKSARQLIDTYKVQQMNIIDENIMAMLEKTLSLVLAKNLSLKDQMDFVYESLEKAKAEKFLV